MMSDRLLVLSSPFALLHFLSLLNLPMGSMYGNEMAETIGFGVEAGLPLYLLLR
jgi:hypothetical protein